MRRISLSVAAGGRVRRSRGRTYGGEEGEQQLGCVWDEVLVQLVDRVDGEDGILSHKRVAVVLRRRVPEGERSAHCALPSPSSRSRAKTD